MPQENIPGNTDRVEKCDGGWKVTDKRDVSDQANIVDGRDSILPGTSGRGCGANASE